MILAMQPPRAEMTTVQCDEGLRLFLWSTRRWVALRFRQQDPVPVLKAAFKQHGIAESAESIDRLMTCIAGSARRRLNVGVTSGIELSADEQVMVRAVSAASDQPELACALMQSILDRCGARHAAEILTAISACLRLAGLQEPASENGMKPRRGKPALVWSVAPAVQKESSAKTVGTCAANKNANLLV